MPRMRRRPCALGALEDVDVEGAAHEGWPVDARGCRQECAGFQAIPVRDAEDVGREWLGERNERWGA